MSIPEFVLIRHKDPKRGCFLTGKGRAAVLSEPEIHVRIRPAEDLSESSRIAEESGESERVFTVFQQNAMNYAEFSDYLNHHGCACCSLTSLLTAFCPSLRALRPEDTIRQVERKHFPEEVWKRNYEGALRDQMPVTLYGISRILEAEGVPNRYVGSFRDREACVRIREHLRSGRPVVIETSRVRRKNGIPVSVNDRKYAGSYHTMILLGYDRQGRVIFTDSATRDWAGEMQRLKRDRLSSLIRYMFPRWNRRSTNLYFDHRWNTGGFILIDG